ncbi:MAG: hypothetical protein ACKOPE_01535 [Novosphingobium sp.]
MKTIPMRSALALPLLLAAQVAQADTDSTETEILAQGYRADAHGPAGTMAVHVHKRGDLMIGVMWMHEDYGGSNQSGTAPVSDQQIADAGFAAKTDRMSMDMAMFHLMYAPSDRVTLMLASSWMRMDMTMKGLPASTVAPPLAHAGHAMLPGETMGHSVAGIGDTQFGALVSLSRRPQLSVHAGLMVSAPTGDAARKGSDGNYLHYMMQGGSGTWDLIPSLTLRGGGADFGWGAQTSYVFRAEKKNAAGFRFGDRFTATAWLSKPLSQRLSLSGRLAWSDEGPIKGHYNAAHSHASPPDRQANYGGQRLEGGLGFSTVVGERLRIGGEVSVPLYQDLNGIQLPKRWGASLGAGVMF